MRSQWITHAGRQILMQNFSGYYLTNAQAVKEELAAVQQIVVQQPKNSVLVLADFSNTQIGKELMDLLIESSNVTKIHVRKTAVLGVVGTKRVLAEMLMGLTGQQLTFFDDPEQAKDWLAKE
jgi:hypothetical protein